jgi:hypothetical protein
MAGEGGLTMIRGLVILCAFACTSAQRRLPRGTVSRPKAASLFAAETPKLIFNAHRIAVKSMTVQPSPSAGAARMRRHRERRRDGIRHVSVQLWPWGVDQLVALGYLRSTERNDLDAIKAAASEFFSHALSCWDGNV